MAVAVLVIEKRVQRTGFHAAIPNLKILQKDLGGRSLARHRNAGTCRSRSFTIRLHELFERLRHPWSRYRRMPMIIGVTSHGAGTLVKLLNNAGPKFGHLARHFQNHLAAALRSHACPIVLPPGPHIFDKRAIRPSRYGGFSTTGSEIGHAVIASISLPGHPAQAVSIENGIPTSCL